MEDALNVRIFIDNKDGKVVVTGTSRCEEAKKTIESLSCVASFFIEIDYRSVVVGREAHGD